MNIKRLAPILIIPIFLCSANCSRKFTSSVTTSSRPTITWQKTIGTAGCEFASSVASTMDKGFVIVGTTWQSAEKTDDIYVIRCDSLGNLVWQNTFGGQSREEGRSVIALPSGEYIIMGNRNIQSNGMEDVVLIKADSVGNVIWEKTFGGAKTDIGHSMVSTPEGGYAIIGHTTSFGAQGADIYLLKIDAAGNSVWEKRYGRELSDAGESVIPSADGSFILVGSTNSIGAGSLDVYLAKVNNSGELLWEKTFGGNGSDKGFSLSVALDGGYVVAGTTFGSFKSAGSWDVYLIKTDTIGNLSWQKTFGSPEEDRGYSIYTAHDGGYIIAGSTGATIGKGPDGYLIKTDSKGNLLWEKTSQGAAADGLNYVSQARDKGYISVGYTYSGSAGCSDVYFLKTDANGNVSIP